MGHRGRGGLAIAAVLAVAVFVPPASSATTPPAPRLVVEDAPITRNRTVKLSIIPSDGNEVAEYRVSNDGSRSAGMLTNYETLPELPHWPVYERKVDWLLPDDDGSHTVYAQLLYEAGHASEIAELSLILDRSGRTSLYVESDRAVEQPLALWPSTDFHTRTKWPAERVYATTASRPDSNSLTVKDEQWAVTFTYTGPIRSGSYAISNPGDGPCAGGCIDVSHLSLYNQASCRATSGTFVLHDVTFDASGDLLSASADFSVGCSWIAIDGAIRYGSQRTLVALDQDEDLFDFGEVHVGQASAERTVTFTNIGDSVAQLGALAFAGRGAGDYETTADTCSSRSLAIDASCEVRLRARPPTTGWRRGFLTLPDNTFGGARKVVLETTAVVPTSLELAEPIIPPGAGPVRFVVTVTPPPPCAPELSVNGRPHHVNAGSEALTNPSRRAYRFDVDTMGPGKHQVRARFRGCDYYLSSGPIDIEVTIAADRTPPRGYITINAGAEYTNQLDVALDLSAVDGASDVGEMAVSNDGQSWEVSPYTSWKNWRIAGNPGVNTVYAKFKDVAGNWSDVVSDTIIYDGAPPQASAPDQAFVEGSSIVSGKVAVEVTWSGSDQGAGLSLYELGQRRDSGAWGAAQPVPANEAGGEAAVTRSVAPQYGYTFRVRARDSAANQSGWALGRKVNIKRLQEASAQIKYQGRWTRPSTAAYWGGAAMRSTAAGANASLTFSGRSFAWVARTGPDRGKAAIYVNGVLVQTVDLYSPTVRSRRVVFAEHWETSGSRTVTIRVLATAGRPTVELDALLTGD